jgi:hypothetical protein
MVSELALPGNGGKIVIYITALFYAICLNQIHLCLGNVTPKNKKKNFVAFWLTFEPFLNARLRAAAEEAGIEAANARLPGTPLRGVLHCAAERRMGMCVRSQMNVTGFAGL